MRSRMIRTGILLVALLFLGAASSALAGLSLLGCSQYSELFSVDLSTGIATLIGLMPSGLATEIEFDIASGTLYAEETDGGMGLHTIDPATGKSLGSVIHPYGALNGMEFVDSRLYATFIPMGGFPSDLVVVDTSTGALIFIGPTGYGPISGLAYDRVSGVMYGVTAGGMPAVLVTIDLATGAAKPVGPVVDPKGNILVRIGSIEFGPDGKLYGGLTANAPILSNHLIEIDPATGKAEPIGGPGFSITGLTNTMPPSIRMLMAMVDSMDMHEGLRQSLLAKLNAALAALEREQVKTAKNILSAFINEVEAQSGKKLTEEQADGLMDVALAVLGSLDGAHPAPAKEYRIGPEGKLTTIWGQMKVR
jgi:hypothetical protein